MLRTRPRAAHPRLAAAMIACLSLASAPACESKQGPTGENVADQLEAIRDAMCKCNTVECSAKIAARHQQFWATNEFAMGDKYAANRVERLEKELATCERRTRLSEQVAAKPPTPDGFPVDRTNPQLSLAKLVATWKGSGAHTLDLSFDATVNRMMANSHKLLIHAECSPVPAPNSGDKPKLVKDEAAITGEQLNGVALGTTTSAVASLFGKEPLAAKPESCTISFRVGGSPSDFERICLRDTEIRVGECAPANPAAPATVDAPATPSKTK